MTSPAGWYPDPAAGSGQLRYWDGRRWSASNRPAPGVPQRPAKRTKGPLGCIVAGGAFILVLVVVIVLGVRAVFSLTSGEATSAGGAATSSGRSAVPISCGERDFDQEPVPLSSGRVRSGLLSYPALPAPFAAPSDYTVLRARGLLDVAAQFAVLRYQGETTGGADVTLARLPIADGSATPREVAEAVLGCVRKQFPFADEQGPTSHPTTVDGHPAWLIRDHLGYGVIEAGVSSATIILLGVATTDGENGLFYAYLPDTHAELVPIAERVTTQLTVS